MRAIAVFLLTPLFFGVLTTPSSARCDESQIATLEVSGLANGAINLSYRQKALGFVTFVLPLEVQSLSLFPLSAEVITIARTGFGFGVLPDFSITTGFGAQFDLMGWYVEPMVGLGYARIDYPSRYGSQSAFMLKPSFHLGYATTLPFGVYVDASLGIAARYFLPTSAADALIQPSARLAVGYAW